MTEVKIDTETINLDQLLKWAGIIDSGAQVKMYIEDKAIKVNNNIITERRKKIYPGDIIEIDNLHKLIITR